MRTVCGRHLGASQAFAGASCRALEQRLGAQMGQLKNELRRSDEDGDPSGSKTVMGAGSSEKPEGGGGVPRFGVFFGVGFSFLRI